uniref:ATP-dependent Clp protease ATP-binding subunit ClpX n=1 Tax=Anthurium amnicola TaxID=1678845 RepID=A0A1D1Z105_9ARAE
MAPNAERLVGSYRRDTNYKPARLSTAEGLQRAVSDLSLVLSKEAMEGKLLPPISEVEDAKCECCGMSEECTPEYIRRVRDRFCGRWICGLCSEAVKEEVEKKGAGKEEAVHAHMSVCARFNKFGRTHPVLYQAEAMREILKRCSSRSKSSSPREKTGAPKKGGITRSTSCIPAITKEMNEMMTIK